MPAAQVENLASTSAPASSRAARSPQHERDGDETAEPGRAGRQVQHVHTDHQRLRRHRPGVTGERRRGQGYRAPQEHERRRARQDGEHQAQRHRGGDDVLRRRERRPRGAVAERRGREAELVERDERHRRPPGDARDHGGGPGRRPEPGAGRRGVVVAREQQDREGGHAGGDEQPEVAQPADEAQEQGRVGVGVDVGRRHVHAVARRADGEAQRAADRVPVGGDQAPHHDEGALADLSVEVDHELRLADGRRRGDHPSRGVEDLDAGGHADHGLVEAEGDLFGGGLEDGTLRGIGADQGRVRRGRGRRPHQEQDREAPEQDQGGRAVQPSRGTHARRRRRSRTAPAARLPTARAPTAP